MEKASFWERLCYGATLVFRFLKALPANLRHIWYTSGSFSGTHLVFLAAAAALLAGVIALLVTFLRSRWREKLYQLLITLAVLLALGIVLGYILTAVGYTG